MKTWVLFISFIPTVLTSGVTFLHSANQRRFGGAVKYCEQQGQYFLPDDITNSTQMVKYMSDQGIKSVWLALKKRTLKDWTWTNDDLGNKPLSGIQLPDRVCAGVSTVDQTIRAMRCNYGGDHEGYVCEKPGNKNCSGTQQGEYCFSFGDSSFTFQCGINDWYTAEVQCRKKGRVLALLDSSEKVKVFVSQKNRYPSLSMCSFYWIGLRKEDWTVLSPDKGDRKTMESYWAHEQPQHGNDCCMGSLVDGHIQWTTRHCNQLETVVCVRQSKKILPSVVADTTINADIRDRMTDPSAARESGTTPPWWIFGLAGACGLLLLVATVIVAVCIKRRKQRSREKQRQNLVEQESLLQENPSSDCKKDTGDDKHSLKKQDSSEHPGQSKEMQKSSYQKDVTVPPESKVPPRNQIHEKVPDSKKECHKGDVAEVKKTEGSHQENTSAPPHGTGHLKADKGEDNVDTPNIKISCPPQLTARVQKDDKVIANESNKNLTDDLDLTSTAAPVQRKKEFHEAYTGDHIGDVEGENNRYLNKPPYYHKSPEDTTSEDLTVSLHPEKATARMEIHDSGTTTTREVLQNNAGVPDNTVGNCKLLDSMITVYKPVSISMVMSSDREDRMNLYLARDTGKERADIESTLLSVLPAYYTGILGCEGTNKDNLKCMNMLGTRRVLADSATSYLELSSTKRPLPDIVIVETNGETFSKTMKEFLPMHKDKWILIARARQASGDLKTDDIISVGVLSGEMGHRCAYGDNPHFLVFTDYYEHKLYLETTGQPDPHEIAMLYTAIVSSVVILLASSKKWNISNQSKLKSTVVMREILRRMCSHPDQMTDEEGYGVLDPWPFLLNWDKMKKILDETVI